MHAGIVGYPMPTDARIIASSIIYFWRPNESISEMACLRQLRPGSRHSDGNVARGGSLHCPPKSGLRSVGFVARSSGFKPLSSLI